MAEVRYVGRLAHSSRPRSAAGPPYQQEEGRDGPGHSILVIVWYLLTGDCDDQDLGGDFFIRRDTDRGPQRAVTLLQALGHQVTLRSAA